MVVRLSALRSGRSFYSPVRFLILISVRGCVDPRAIVRLEGLSQLKNLVTSTGILPACSIVPQRTTLPRVPFNKICFLIYHFSGLLFLRICERAWRLSPPLLNEKWASIKCCFSILSVLFATSGYVRVLKSVMVVMTGELRYMEIAWRLSIYILKNELFLNNM
jgi:hypothetical protein